jgi:hypothetical protein
LLLGLWGTWQTFCTSCCLGLFIVLGIVSTGLDDALVIKAATSNYYIAERLAQYDVLYNGTSAADTAQLVSEYQSKIKVPSYIFLAPLILQTIACICLCLARIFKPFKADIQDQDEEQSRRSTLAQVQLESLKRSTRKSATGHSIPETNLYTSSSKMNKR